MKTSGVTLQCRISIGQRLGLEPLVLTSLHHGGRLVKEGGQAVIDGALLCNFKCDHGTGSCHEFCCPRKKIHGIRKLSAHKRSCVQNSGLGSST